MKDRNFYTESIRRLYGRRRGQVWRADRDWFAGDSTNEEVRHNLQLASDDMRRRRESFHNRGFNRSKTQKLLGVIPMEVMMCHPELWHDDAACRRFLKDNPEYSARGYGGEK